MWFNREDLITYDTIVLNDLKGYVLPHAGTKFCGQLISHTLRFRPRKKPKNIFIIYLPAHPTPNVFWSPKTKQLYNSNDDSLIPLFHEFAVPWLSLMCFLGDIPTYAFNVLDANCDTSRITNETLIVVSADYAHSIEHQKAIELENRASASIMLKSFIDKLRVAIDDERSFRKLYEIIPDDWMLQWIGRSRSSVGYMSFLIRSPEQKKCDGFFVTAYDNEFVARECLGKWQWSQTIEDNMISSVINLAQTTSRLTGGANLDRPIIGYTIYYLYRSSGNFIRGWHGILCGAFYLPTVMLEHTYENGQWIKPGDIEWPNFSEFDMSETLKSLGMKAGFHTNKCELYESSVRHVLI